MKPNNQPKKLEQLLIAYVDGTFPPNTKGDYEVRKPNGYWRNFSNVVKVLEGLEKILGHFPTQKEIAENGYAGLPKALNDYYGGINRVAERLGKTTSQRARGYWKLGIVKSLCESFVEEHGHFPSNKELNNRDDKYKGLMSGINKYGGIGRIKRLLKVKSDKIPTQM